MGFVDLKTGVMIIGYFKFVMYILLLIYGLYLAAGVDDIIDNEEMKELHSFFGKTLIATSTISLFFTGLLVSGAYRGDACQLYAYIIFTYIFLGLGAMSFLMNPVVHVVVLLSFGLEIYFVIVVHSYLRELQKKQGTVHDVLEESESAGLEDL